MADLDRKIRGIYDALDARNWKRAIQSADGVLAKWKGQPQDIAIVYVLKAVALERLGRITEAMEVCEVVRNMRPPPTDEHALSTMMIVYKAAGKPELMAELYEEAVKVGPSQELYRQLFTVFMRCSDLVKQQQTAMKLNRLYGGEKYVWWVIVTTVLQARAAMIAQTSAMNPSQLLKLGQTLVTRQIDKSGGKLSSFEEILVYMDILHGQGEHQAALDAIRGDLGNVISLAQDRSILEAHCLERAGRTAEAAEIYQQLLEGNPDDWALLKIYLDCCLPGTAEEPAGQASHRLVGLLGGVEVAAGFSSPPALEGDVIPSSNSSPAAFVESLIEKTSHGPHAIRGPLLAHVELSWRQHLFSARKIRNGDTDSFNSDELTEAVLAFFRATCTKVSCAADLRPFMKALQQSPRHAEAIAAEVFRLCEEADSGPEEDTIRAGIQSLRRRVAAYQLRHDVGLLGSPSHAPELMQLYSSTLHLSKETGERERGAGDELVTLAVSCMLSEAPSKGQHTDHLLAALLVATAGRHERPYSPGTRLASAAILGLLGCPQAAHIEFAALDVKSIQHSSLTVHFLLPLLTVGSERPEDKKLRPILKEVLALHEDHVRDHGDTLLMAYNHGSYSKVFEFIHFAERLKHCHSRYLAAAELVAFNLRAAAWGTAADLKVEALEGRDFLHERGMGPGTEYAGLRFNEDLSVRPDWFPPHAGSCQSAVPEWWKSHWEAPHTGFASCWWSKLNCTESNDPQAKALRDSLVKALRRRSLLPRLLLGAMAAGEVQANQDGAAAQFSETLAELCTLLGMDMDPSKLAASAAASTATEHDCCNLALWMTADRFAGLLAPVNGPGSEGALADCCTALCETLQAATERACSLLVPASVAIRGDGIVLTASLLQEVLSWLTICLESWFTNLKAHKKGKGKKADGGGTTQEAAAKGRSHLGRLSAAALQALGRLSDAIQAALGAVGEKGAAASALEVLEAKHAALWSWSSKAKPKDCIGAVLAEQSRRLQALAEVTANRIQRVKALPMN